MYKNLLSFILLLVSTSIFSQSFNSIWNTTNISSGSSGVDQITIPTNPAYTTYNYTVDWGDGSSDTGVTGDITHTYASQGPYTIQISGTFPSIYFNDTGDRLKIIEILDWGNIQWQTMENAFFGCENLNFDAINSPDLSQVSSLKNMFRQGFLFNGIINNWDVSTITDISGMFYNARVFNRPLDNWTTNAITDMSETFFGASIFNEPLDNWNTAAVSTMEGMFQGATRFDQNIDNWNVANVVNMSRTFLAANNFNKPLNNWNVTNVTDMSLMFDSSAFNQSLNNWDVSNVTNMSRMFNQAIFNQPIDNWDVSSVTDMSSMFQRHRTFNQPLNNWNVSNVTDMSSMFDGWIWGAIFNQPLDNWDVSNVTNMKYMFRDNTGFNQPIGNWNVSEVTDMQGMFNDAPVFNQDISTWNVSKVENMASMFSEADAFNQPLDSWNVSAVTNMSAMFLQTSAFNQPLNSWNVSLVTSMANMFKQNPIFNQPLNNWNTAAVTSMSGMFENAGVFDQNLASWNITSVANMTNMLSNSALSQTNYDNTLIGWEAQAVRSNVSLGATGLNYCDGRDQRQNLIDTKGWTMTGDIINCSFVLCTNLVSPVNGDTNVPASANLTWAFTPGATGYRVTVRIIRGGVESIPFNNHNVVGGNVVGLNLEDLSGNDLLQAGDEVFVTIVPYNDTDGPAVGCTEESFTVVPSWVNSPAAFKLTYDTRLTDTGTTPINQLKIETDTGFPNFLTYDYSIDWGDDQFDNNVTSDITHTYLTPGVYTIAIIGDFPAPYHDFSFTDAYKLISIDQWGTQQWQSMERAFYDCENMEYNAVDIPDLSAVTNMDSMFGECDLFDGNIDAWDVSNVTNMRALFIGANTFNQPLNNWNVGNVTNMSLMFLGTDNFNQPLNNWDTKNVIGMSRMFEQADAFNQNINSWNVSNVADMSRMFQRAIAFNQPLNSWDVSNVLDMSRMFDGFVINMVFNQPLDSWDVSNVVDMSQMFRRNIDFNQPLNSWDVSKVELMNSMFENATVFNQPLSSWNVGEVINMGSMFQSARNFNQPLNSWDVAKVTNMAAMFQNASLFNQPIENWNVSRVTNMFSMFNSAQSFNQPLQNWDVNSVVNMAFMFAFTDLFNQPLDAWDVSAVANMSSMFEKALVFDQPLNSWNTSSVTLMPSMFEGATLFNSSIDNWNVASVTNMQAMFKDAMAFNQPIQNWDTGEVLTMEEMFNNASAFNQNIDPWDVSFVTTMEAMFDSATSYNQPLSSWNVASVTTMERMFKNAIAFNQDINTWNVRGVDTMHEMFSGASVFNQSLNNWRVSGVSNMDYMFNDASAYNQPMDQWNLGNVSMRSTFFNATSLNQDLSAWDVSSVTDMRDMLDNTALSRENYDNTLIAWSEQSLTPGITLGAEGLPYCDAEEERQSMIDNFGWTVSGDVRDCPIPTCTQLTSPLNGDTDVPVNTNITWEHAQYARGYRLTVGTSPGGNDVVDNETIVNETFYEFASDFSTGTVVYVTLIPYNDEGDAVGPCTEESFTISSDPATIPDCTTLSNPIHNANDVAVTTDLNWNPIVNADGYRIYVGTSSGGNEILNAEDVGNATTYNFPADLPENSDIYVTIIPYNAEGDAVSCSEEVFHTEIIPVPPVCTNLITPANAATDVPIDINLSWTTIGNATGYLISIGTTSGGIEIANNIDVGPATTYDIPSDLQEDRLYFVTIIPYNDEGDAVGCAEETFRTGNSNSPPSCAILSAPTNGATAVSPDTNLTWNGSGNADGYRIDVGTTSGGADLFSGDVGNVTFLDLASDLPESTVIYVSIIAYNANGDAVGCTEESFTTSGPPTCTTLLSPTNTATNVPINTTIEWNAIADVDGYKLTVTGSISTTNNLTDFDVTSGTTYSFANDFTQGETVTVTIIPYNSNGDATGCSSESFTIVPPPLPICTTLTTPLNGDIAVAPDTDITWNAVTDATAYKLTVTGSISTINNLTDFDVTSGTTYSFANDFIQGETVSVTIVPYNAQGDAIGCTTESFTIKPVPGCNSLIIPGDGAIDVDLDTDITWTTASGATGYRVTVVASNSTANNITNHDTTDTFYNFPSDFEQGETVTVTITPYNEVGDAIGCASESFTLKAVPACAQLTSPLNGDTDVPLDTDISWATVPNTNGYRITVTGSVSSSNNLTDFDVSTVTSYNFLNDFEQGETVTVTIVPYNDVGDAIGCTAEQFTIESVPACTNLISPANGDVVSQAPNISWNEITNADGYKLTISGSNTNINDVTDFVFTGTTYVFPNTFTQGEEVTVTIVPFNAIGDAMGCTSESFTIRPVPACTSLISPVNNATQVAVLSDISWNESFDADGYRISVGTSPNGTDIVNNEDVASLTNYTFAEDLPSETLIYVTITPYNTSGAATGCTSESFTTEIIAPECTRLLSPANGEEDVSLEPTISWTEIEKTDGYRLSIGTTSGGTDILNNQDMGSETTYTPTEELPFNTQIYVTIIPYNSVGDAASCEEQSFTTLIPEDNTKYGFSPNGDGVNEYWNIEHIENYPENTVIIYNRWGDAVFKTQGYNNTSNVFRGDANQMTKMGAGRLPEGTYFFQIIVPENHILKATQGYLVLKR